MGALNSVTCTCPACRQMCADSTCLPTPDEARDLIRRGFGARLATYRFHPDPEKLAAVGPAPAGREGARDLPMTKTGVPCTFFDGQHCELHAAGLKPWEGRMALHDRPWQPIRMALLRSWAGRRFDSVVVALDNKQRGS